MLTINRPFYEYRDIYLFIAVGLAAFITTFVVLGVLSIIDIDQLSRSTQTSEKPIPLSSPADANKTKDTETKSDAKSSSAGQSGNPGQSHQSAATPTKQSAVNTPVPLAQPSSISAPQAAAWAPAQGSSSGQSQTPVVIVQQPAVSAPAPSVSAPQNSGGTGSGSLINLPTNLLPRLPVVSGLINL